MEKHIIEVVRYGVCVTTLIISIIAMIKADDNNAMRRLSALLAAVLIYFNKDIGQFTYLAIGSFIVVMALPVIVAFRWLRS